MNLAVVNGKIVDSEGIYQADIVIRDGIITGISRGGPIPGDIPVIDASGKLVFPGFIDCHAHFNEPGYTWREDFITGSMAAAAGGVTTVVDMPLQGTPPVISGEAFEIKAREVAPKSYVDYRFWGGFINNNLDTFAEQKECGAYALKAFMSGAGEDYPSVNNGLIKRAMEMAVEMDLMLGFHCEDFHIIKFEEEDRQKNGKTTRRDFLESRPLIAELIATKNIIDLSRVTGAKVHICHVSHPAVAEEIRKARQEGVRVTGETCPHYLVFTEEDMVEKGTLLKCAPPLRDAEAREGLWSYLLDGTLSCVVSDHSPATWEEKSDEDGKKSVWKVWSGISGVQTGAQVFFHEAVNNRGLCPSLVARQMSEGPARVHALEQKGQIRLGFDGDLAIVDPQKSWTITEEGLFYKNKISGFCGLSGKGLVEKTIVRGALVFDNGEIVGAPGYGKLLRRNGQ